MERRLVRVRKGGVVRGRVVRAGVIAALVALAACSLFTGPEVDDLRWADLGIACSADAPAIPLSAVRRDSLPPAEDNLNGQWADLALHAPGGWGGYFIGGAGPTIYLVDTTQLLAAAAFLRSEGLDIPSSVVARQGRWDFAQLYDWFRYLRPFLFALEGTSVADINEATNRLEYGVVDEATRTSMEGVLIGLGVPCYLVAIDIRARPMTLSPVSTP
jgi:hypothetical protein